MLVRVETDKGNVKGHLNHDSDLGWLDAEVKTSLGNRKFYRRVITTVKAETKEDTLFLMNIQKKFNKRFLLINTDKERFPKLYILDTDDLVSFSARTNGIHLNLPTQEFGERMIYRRIALDLAIESGLEIMRISNRFEDGYVLEYYSYEMNSFVEKLVFDHFEDCLSVAVKELKAV